MNLIHQFAKGCRISVMEGKYGVKGRLEGKKTNRITK
jgi:hypothetical protein